MTLRLFVKTRFADSLIEDLPDAGLSGTKVADTVVRIDSDDDPDDLEFELGWYADRFGIAGFRVLPEETDPSSGDSLGDQRKGKMPMSYEARLEALDRAVRVTLARGDDEAPETVARAEAFREFLERAD